MKNKFFLIIIVLILFTAGCSSIERDWDLATGAGTSSAFRTFLQEHPDSKYSADAQAKIEKVDWEQVQSSINPDAFRTFLKKYPDSQYSTDAQARMATLDKEAWDKIKNDDSVHTFRHFLWTHPDSTFSVEADTKIATMAKTAWKKALQENKAYSYKTFLKTYPDCEFSSKALSNLEQLEAHKAVILLEVPGILSPGDQYSIVFKETNGVGVVFKEKQYSLVCGISVYQRSGSGLVDSDWIKVPPNGEVRDNNYIPWDWDNCSEIRNGWYGGYDDYGNYIEVPYSYQIKVK